MSLRGDRNLFPICHFLRSLQVYHSPESPDRKSSSRFPEETPGAASPLRSAAGSLTVEAALSLTLFLFFALSVLSLFPALQLHLRLRCAMEEAVSEVAVLAEPPHDSGTVLSSAYFYGRVLSLVGVERLNQSGIDGGSGGLWVRGEALEEGRPEVRLTLSYRWKLPFFPGLSLPLSQTVCQRAWIGAEPGSGAEADESTLVYVAEYGEVYHTSANCTHLLLSVECISASEVGARRNVDGSRYYPCEYCMQGREASMVFITPNGDRYHSDRHCTGLKRTVTVRPLGELDLPPCSRCAGGQDG